MCKTSAPNRLKPSILTRCLAADTAGDTAVALLVLLLLYAAVDLVELNAMVGSSSSGLIYTYLFRLPTAAALLLPFAVALGVSLRYARLRQTGEWEAMQSAGISPLTTYKRLLVVSGGAVLLGAALCLFIGPLGTARFEARMRTIATVSSSTCAGGWTKQKFGFVHFDCRGRVDTVIELDETGRAIARHAAWSAEKVVKPPAPPPLNNLWGQSLTYPALERTLSETTQMGLSGDGLRAERALRVAAILACFLVPAAALALLFVRESVGGRTGRAVLVGIVVTVVYWSMCAAVWNGVAAGLRREIWLSVGVPAAFALISGLGWTGLKLRSRWGLVKNSTNK